MSAVVVRDDVEPRFEALAELMGWDIRKVAGACRYLWRGSQNVNAVNANSTQIIRWAKEPDQFVGMALVEAMTDPSVSLLRKVGPDTYEIVGNRGEVNKKKTREKRSRKASKQRWGGIETHDGNQRGKVDAPSITGKMLEDVPQAKLNQAKPSQAKPKKKENPQVSVFDLDLSSSWLAWAKTQLPSLRANEAKWAATVRQLREIDKLGEDEIRAVFAFVKAHDTFWARNAISLPGLRVKSKNGLSKLENILVQMKEQGASLESEEAYLARRNAEMRAALIAQGEDPDAWG